MRVSDLDLVREMPDAIIELAAKASEDALVERAREVVDCADDGVELGLEAEEFALTAISYLALQGELHRRKGPA